MRSTEVERPYLFSTEGRKSTLLTIPSCLVVGEERIPKDCSCSQVSKGARSCPCSMASCDTQGEISQITTFLDPGVVGEIMFSMFSVSVSMDKDFSGTLPMV